MTRYKHRCLKKSLLLLLQNINIQNEYQEEIKQIWNSLTFIPSQ